MKPYIGAVLTLVNNRNMSARPGAQCVVLEYYLGGVRVRWIRNHLATTQMDGGYDLKRFELSECPW